MKVLWTAYAQEDLRGIFAHIAKDSPRNARKMIARIKAATTRLRRFPRLGGNVEEWNVEDYREIIVGNYRVIYRIENGTVQVLTVLHGARRLPARESIGPPDNE